MALLGELQRVFENTYGRPAGVDLEACVVGARRFAELAAQSPGEHAEMSDWARFFYYVEHANLRLALFYRDEMIAALEAIDPRRSLGESNVLPFLVFTEELSHAVHTTYAFGEGGARRVHEPSFAAELELLARIDAYLLLRHFVRGLVRRYTAADRAWVRHHAVTRWDVPYEDELLAERYQGAARMAAAYVDHLETLTPVAQIRELRRFRRLSLAAKRARIARLN
ncbi:MAG TPA: hypothetical protein VM737_10280 [Gemmatimonadota bacterium]|nr:hypothetical protein [Gemmatimonadota bacterium]